MRSIFSFIVAAGLLGACYSEREPPPNFRYACDRDGDCVEGQTCVDGLCETPCTNDNFAEVCTRGELVCLNGVCSSGCEVGGASCPGAQECVDLGLDLGGGGSFLSSGSSDAVIGVCMRECSDSSCPAGNVCIEGFCVQSCLMSEECPAGTSCTGNLCLPDNVATTGDTVDTLDGSSSSTSEDTLSSSDSDPTATDPTTTDPTTDPTATTGAT